MDKVSHLLHRDRRAAVRPAAPDSTVKADSVQAGRPVDQADIAAQAAHTVELKDYKTAVLKEVDGRDLGARDTMILDFLEIADNLERATAAWKTGGAKGLKAVKDGVDSVLRLFRLKLERYAVTSIEAKGRPFDPHLHHAVSQAVSADVAPGTVLHELQRGYRIDGRLLRPSAVVVATAPGPSSGQQHNHR